MEQRDRENTSPVLPDWMSTTTKVTGTEKGKKSNGFIRKTISSVSRVIMVDIMGERQAVKKGLLQGIDPRVKLLSLLFFMVFTAVTRSMITLVLLAALAVAMVVTSKLDLRSYIKRVWLLIPLITLVVSLPACTNLFVQGDAVLYLYRHKQMEIGSMGLAQGLYFTLQGITAVLRTVIRIGISLSFGYLLVMTTRWSHITKALAVLKVPKIIIAVLDMTYRYIFVLCSTVVQMFEARHLRTVGFLSNRENRRFVANSIGFLFIKANHFSEEIYDSMVCRGYTGEMVALKEFHLTGNDIVWIINNLVIAILLIII